MTQYETEAAVVADLATRSTDPATLEHGDVYALVVPNDHRVEVIDRISTAERPRRKTGTAHVHDAGSFTSYLLKHQTPDTEVFADLINQKIVGVINAHGSMEDEANWGDHQVRFQVQETDSWKAWSDRNDRQMTQEDFAEFMQDHAADIREPDAATVLEVAQSLSATISTSFESSRRLDNGQVNLVYREQIDGKAGETNQLQIPTSITLAFPPFEGAEHYQISARFRYRISGGRLSLSYKLDDPVAVMRHAFEQIVDKIDEDVDGVVYRGTPA